MNAREILRLLQTISPPVSVRTILITGDTMSEDTRQFAEVHSLPLVMKPVDMEELSAVLNQTALVSGANASPAGRSHQ
jgi:response regulator RpfG family c-di-GMP phosphodiesterase